MTVTWWKDASAFATYLRLKEEMLPFCARNFPSYELSHAGFNQNETTGEVIIKLHLNPKGLVKCSHDISLLAAPKGE